MTTDKAMATREPGGAIVPYDDEDAARSLAHVLGSGDLARLTNEQRVAHYLRLCHSLGVNPLSRPYDWLVMDGKLVLYPNKSLAEQLRRQHEIRVQIVREESIDLDTDDPMYVVKVEGTTPTGRTDQATKYVPLTAYNSKTGKTYRLTGTQRANAYAKAETGAKRRLVFSMVGMASPPDPDETRGDRFVTVDGVGRIIDNPTQEQQALAEDPRMARAIGEPIYEDYAGSISYEGVADQRVRPEELERPRREGPRPTLHADVETCRRRYFAIVEGTRYAEDDERHALIYRWTVEQGWPEAKRADSLPILFKRCTDREARDFLDYAEALAGSDKAAQAAPEPRPTVSPKVHAAALLTGAPIARFELPNEPDWGAWEAAPPHRPEVLREWETWTGAARKLDPASTFPEAETLSNAELLAALGGVVSAVERVHHERFGDADFEATGGAPLVDAF